MGFLILKTILIDKITAMSNGPSNLQAKIRFNPKKPVAKTHGPGLIITMPSSVLKLINAMLSTDTMVNQTGFRYYF